MAMRPIPITAFGVINALGAGRQAMVDALSAGRTGLAEPKMSLPFDTMVGAVDVPLPAFEGALRPYETRLGRLMLHLINQIDPELARLRSRWAPERIGVFLGTSTAGAAATEVAYTEYLNTGRLPESYDFKKQHTFGAVLKVMSTLTGARGPGWVVSTACTSSAKTVASAKRMMAAGVIDAAIVGGVDTLCEMTLQGFWSLSALSNAHCRPFSKESGGINIGEGGALVLMERDGDAIGLIDGIGESSDAYHISAPHPEGLGARLAMERALPAGCSPADIDHVNAHGTGTPHNDNAESKAIRALLGGDVPVISTKGYTGHTLGGAGATEIALSLITMDEGWIAPSVGADPVNADLGINIITEKTPAKVRRVLSNSFAFGGNNISLSLRAPS